MRRWTLGGALLAALSVLILVAACGSSGGSTSTSSSSGSSGSGATAGLTPPQAGTAVPSSVGKTEGKLNLIAWEGYAQPQWESRAVPTTTGSARLSARAVAPGLAARHADAQPAAGLVPGHLPGLAGGHADHRVLERQPVHQQPGAQLDAGQQLPEVNVVVVGVLLLTVIPVIIAARLTGGGGVTRGSAAAAIPGE